MAINNALFNLWVKIKKPSNTIWITPVFGALFGVVFIILAHFSHFLLPVDLGIEIKQETLNAILDIIASSMLAVSTFSLSIMVSAFASASSGATPRATELVMGDDNTRLAIASFISAFVFAVIAKIALGIGYYDATGLLVLFIGTLIVLLYVIYTLIMWVKTLSQLGRLDNTLAKIEEATQIALKDYRSAPNMGGMALEDITFEYAVLAEQSGYLTHINISQLQELAEEYDFQVQVVKRPGSMVYVGMPLAYISKEFSEDNHYLASSFVIEKNRTYAQDPKFGLVVLSEVAQRALSPAVNDPGTAIVVMMVLLRLLIDKSIKQEDPKYDRVFVVKLDESDWVEQPFSPICRDGSGCLEIHIRMQKILAIIAKNAPEKQVRIAARRQAMTDVNYAEQGLAIESEKEQIWQLHRQLFDTSDSKNTFSL